MIEVRVGASNKFKLHLNSTSFKPFSVIITPLTEWNVETLVMKQSVPRKPFYIMPIRVQARHWEVLEKCEAIIAFCYGMCVWSSETIVSEVFALQQSYSLCTPIVGIVRMAQPDSPGWSLTSNTSEPEILASSNHISQTPKLTIHIKDKCKIHNKVYIFYTQMFHLLPHSYTTYYITAVMKTSFGIRLI